MSCATIEKVSVVEVLTEEVAAAGHWNSVESMIALMKRVIETQKSAKLSGNERQKVWDLGTTVENRTIEILTQEVSDLISEWEENIFRSAKVLKSYREQYRELAATAPTSRLRNELYAQATRIKEAMDARSEKTAEEGISFIDQYLSAAEEVLTRPESDVTEDDVHEASCNLSTAERRREEMIKIPHLKHVGIPRVAKKQNVNPATLMDDLLCRYTDGAAALIPLVKMVNDRRREDDKKRLAQREIDTREAQSRYLADKVEEAVVAIERRNDQAGKAARQFLENIERKNAGVAWACLNDIRRFDGGVPPELMGAYQRLSQKS